MVLVSPSADSFNEILAHDSLIPRAIVALVCGAALGVSGAVFQQILRTPFAEPGTLGVSAGAQLALTIATVLAPGVAADARELICFAGATTAILLILWVGLPHRLQPLILILAGLMTTMVCGAISATIALFHDRGLTSLFLWGSGSLNQNDWSAVTFLVPRVSICFLVLALVVRPMTLLSLADEQSHSLGLTVPMWRTLSIALAVALAAFTVSAVGVIGFVGLAGPLIAGMAGARTLTQRLILAGLIGAGLLLLTDEIVEQIARFAGEIPTGGATALLGAPILIILLRRFRPRELPPSLLSSRPLAHPIRWFAGILIVLAAIAFLSLTFSRGLGGWNLTAVDGAFLRWRWPGLLGSASAGALLGAAGCVVQRITGNPMASPEVLGVNSGAAFGILALLLLGGTMNPQTQMLWSCGGACLALFLVLGASWRVRLSPDHTLLAGMAINTIFAGLLTTLMGLGEPRMYGLLQWMAGSTYGLVPFQAVAAFVPAGAALAIIPLTSRPLLILPLGSNVAQGLGINVSLSRIILLLYVAISAAVATLLVGPLSFVGLMAPHMARAIGFRHPVFTVFAASMMGATILCAADWIGRIAMYPNQLPTGVVATLIGSPYFLWLIRRRTA